MRSKNLTWDSDVGYCVHITTIILIVKITISQFSQRLLLLKIDFLNHILVICKPTHSGVSQKERKTVQDKSNINRAILPTGMFIAYLIIKTRSVYFYFPIFRFIHVLPKKKPIPDSHNTSDNTD